MAQSHASHHQMHNQHVRRSTPHLLLLASWSCCLMAQTCDLRHKCKQNSDVQHPVRSVMVSTHSSQYQQPSMCTLTGHGRPGQKPAPGHWKGDKARIFQGQSHGAAEAGHRCIQPGLWTSCHSGHGHRKPRHLRGRARQPAGRQALHSGPVCSSSCIVRLTSCKADNWVTCCRTIKAVLQCSQAEICLNATT